MQQLNPGRHGMDNPIKAVEDAKDMLRRICGPHAYVPAGEFDNNKC